jgi:hypothetical protein
MPDRGLRHPEATTERRLTGSRRELTSDLTNLLIREFGDRRFLAAILRPILSSAATSRPLAVVVRLGAEMKMRRVDAGRVVAAVEDIHPVRDEPAVSDLPREPVRHDEPLPTSIALTAMKEAVTERRARTLPFPTVVG